MLQTLGGQGLYSRETELEERNAEAILRRDAVRSQAWCARVVHDLIEHRKQAATKAVLTPLENRLTNAFAQLSQGSKEQLRLCLAVAQELATEEAQVLILDDVPVNMDPVRQERILDVLGTQAARLQILILTCHPDRYRRVGGQSPSPQ